VLTSLNRLADLAKDTPGALPLLQSIAETINSIDEISRQAPAAPDTNATQMDEIAKEKHGLFVEKLHMKVMPDISTAVEKAAKTILGNKKVGEEWMQGFHTDIRAEYIRLTKADKEFQAKARSYIEAKDTDGFQKLTRSNITAKMPTAARNINRKYQGFQTQEMQRRQEEGQSRVEGAAGGSQAGAKMRYAGKMIQGGPDPAIVDWARMRTVAGGKTQAEDMMFDHRFFVKGDPKNEYYW
jgi:hypothetical protein